MNKKNGFTIVELIVVIGIFFVMLALLAPFARMAKNRSRKINCANNLRHISLGLHAYASDHDDAFPKSLAELYPNYVGDEAVFDCPASKMAGTRANPDYNYIPGLTERASANKIIVEDAEGNHRKAGKNVLKVSGAVEWVSSRR